MLPSQFCTGMAVHRRPSVLNHLATSSSVLRIEEGIDGTVNRRA